MEDQQTRTHASLPVHNAMNWIEDHHGKEYLEQFTGLALWEPAIEVLDT
jgi:hypothetical protein